MFQLAFADLIYSKNQNHNLDLRLVPFINILKTLQINIIILDTVVEVIVPRPADLLAIIVLIHVHIHALDIILKPPPVHFRLITIVIDLDMTNITIQIPTNLTFLRAHIITLILLVVHLNITLVLENVPQILILLLLKDTILLIVLLLNHAMIVIAVDLIQIHTITLNRNTKHL